MAPILLLLMEVTLQASYSPNQRLSFLSLTPRCAGASGQSGPVCGSVCPVTICNPHSMHPSSRRGQCVTPTPCTLVQGEGSVTWEASSLLLVLVLQALGEPARGTGREAGSEGRWAMGQLSVTVLF